MEKTKKITKTVSFRLSEEELRVVNEIAEKQDLSVSQIIRKALREYLEKQE